MPEHRKIFSDRREAGLELAAHLRRYAAREDVVVLALPRGGVPVAFEVAEALDASLDIFLVRKLGLPGYTKLTTSRPAKRYEAEPTLHQARTRDWCDRPGTKRISHHFRAVLPDQFDARR